MVFGGDDDVIETKGTFRSGWFAKRREMVDKEPQQMADGNGLEAASPFE